MKKELKNRFLKSFVLKYLKEEKGDSVIEIFSSILKEKGILSDAEIVLFRRLLTFKNKDVRDIMIPRGEIFAVPADKTLREVMPSVSEKGFSRIPAYDGNLDKIVGILYVKDIVFYFPPDPDIKIKDLLRKAHFVSETMKLNELYREFKKHRVHIAVVVDEYGSVSGLVTLEDLLEEIFGEIEDEYDQIVEPEVKITGENEVIALGRANLEKLFEVFGEKIEVKGVDTVNGLLCHLKNGIPEEGDTFEYGGLVFRVLESDPRQAKKIYITRKKTPV